MAVVLMGPGKGGSGSHEALQREEGGGGVGVSRPLGVSGVCTVLLRCCTERP